MKYYESHFDEYVKAVENYNLHPELTLQKEPLQNLIYYGGSGVGKYSQALMFISQFSTLEHCKRICFQNEKFNFQYFVSDVHYEVDMSLLGCNSKILWHDVIQQIVDIVQVSKPSTLGPTLGPSLGPLVPSGIVLCKNFHLIHSELLEIFYSYIQEYNSPLSPVQLRFILLTEHVSFLPNNILDACRIISVKRPDKELYKNMVRQEPKLRKYIKQNEGSSTVFDDFVHKVSCGKMKAEVCEQTCAAINSISMDHVLNIKEINQLSYNNSADSGDVFNRVCDTIIGQMMNGYEPLTGFRDALYDILIYNLDVGDCLWYILSHFLRGQSSPAQSSPAGAAGLVGAAAGVADSIVLVTTFPVTPPSSDKGSYASPGSAVLIKMHDTLKYFNNNYRPIYHLENMMLFIVKQFIKRPTC